MRMKFSAAILMAAMALSTGCVYQPINIDVYVPTAVQVGGDVTLDTVGNKLSEAAQ